MEGKAYVDALVNDLHSQTLSTIVDILQSNPDHFRLTSDQKKLLSTGSKHAKIGFRTQVEIFKDQLLSMWNDYEQPDKSIQDVISDYNSTRMQILATHHQNEVFHVAAARKMGTPYIHSPPPLIPDFDSCYKQVGDRFFSMSLINGTVNREVLLNPINFQLNDIQNQIVIDSHDKSLNVLETVRNILQYGSTVGMPKTKIAELLKNLIRRYDSDNYGVFNFINSPLEIFTTVIGLVSYSTRLESIKRAVSRITRKPGEPLEPSVKKYCSLLMAASPMEQPNMTKHN